MDQTTIADIRQRVARWKRDEKSGKESERTWIFAVNEDDVALMLAEIERLSEENSNLRDQIGAFVDHLWDGTLSDVELLDNLGYRIFDGEQYLRAKPLGETNE